MTALRAPLSLSGRRTLCGTVVTLNGRPAVICGARERRATVLSLDHLSHGQWSWRAVARIVAAGGAFQT